MKYFLNSNGIATSRTSRYNPKGNGQIERYNGIIWKTIQLGLISKKLPMTSWEIVLPDALHSIRSLLCTSTNTTPHERLFQYNRKSTAGNSIPSWLTSGPIYVRKHVQKSKYDPIVEKAELLHANPQYAYVRLEGGHETTVSLRDVAPCKEANEYQDLHFQGVEELVDNDNKDRNIESINKQESQIESDTTNPNDLENSRNILLQRPIRNRKPRDRFIC